MLLERGYAYGQHGEVIGILYSRIANRPPNWIPTTFSALRVSTTLGESLRRARNKGEMMAALEEARDALRERGPKKMSITNREFVWVQSDDGEVTLFVGPCMVSPTATDRIVVDDGNGGFRDAPSRDHTQRMVEVGDNQYAVLGNPLETPDVGYPNGTFKPARNDIKPLRNGTKQMIPGPCSFYLRPGQRCEVRDAHELASNQYLVVKVYGEVDNGAPYYDITALSAGITTSTVDRDGESAEAAEISDSLVGEFQRGNQIVIRGIDTQFYIPPTGVDIVPDTSFDSSGAALSARQAQEILQNYYSNAASQTRGVMDGEEKTSGEILLCASASTADSRAGKVEQAARRRHRGYSGTVQQPANLERLLGAIGLDSGFKEQIKRTAGQSRLVRDAVVLTEKEFCVIIDADGRRNVKVGPARVFPGPYDTFMTEGSRNRIYDAYELLPQRALWLRVISKISKQDLAAKLPVGLSTMLDSDVYYPGDEILLNGINAFFFPFNEIEVLSPETGQSHVGNDHDKVLIEAIGIDQKSGIYVRDLDTGEARLVRGKQSYLVNPAKEVHINRIVSDVDWNHWIAFFRSHKRVSSNVVTPWALSIRIPHNTAVLATSAEGQRVIEGPCVELLEYEEKLAYLNLSTGTPKSDRNTFKTCFLQVTGNRVSDVVRVETSDFVEIDVQVTYRVAFDRDCRDKWFNHENYVQLLVEHTRSLIRNHCRTTPLANLWLNLSSIVRDLILGDKDPETGDRTGRFFDENGMRIVEVEVLSSSILDESIASQFTAAQKNIVSLQIGNREAEAKLDATKFRARIADEEREVQRQKAQKQAALDDLLMELEHTAVMSRINSSHARETNKLVTDSERAMVSVLERLKRQEEEDVAHRKSMIENAQAEANAARQKNQAQLEYREADAELEKLLIKARSDATVAENQSIQERLVEALTALGDKQLLSTAAENMNLVSLFRGKDVSSILSDVLGKTKLAGTIEEMKARAAALVAKSQQD